MSTETTITAAEAKKEIQRLQRIVDVIAKAVRENDDDTLELATKELVDSAGILFAKSLA